MKIATLAALAAVPLTLSACAQERPGDRPAVSPAARIVGEAQTCIPITRIRQTHVRDDYTIDFEGAGGKVWRNTLPTRCSGLAFEDSFTYETSLSQLCNTDIIYVLRNTGGVLQRGAGCGLGTFVPVELADD